MGPDSDCQVSMSESGLLPFVGHLAGVSSLAQLAHESAALTRIGRWRVHPENQTDHIALLALMLVGMLIKRLEEVGQLDDATAHQIHRLVGSVRTHARNAGLEDLNILFDNIDRALGDRRIAR